MTDIPICSILLPVFDNHEDVITAIQSVIAQTFKSWELIIVDDYSTDDTATVVKNFIKNHVNMRFIQNSHNVGTYVSLNEALKIARGRYIARIDSDDAYHPAMLKTSIQFLEKNPKYVATMARGQKGAMIAPCPAALVYRKVIINEIGYYDSVRFAADTEFIHRIRKKYGKNRIMIINQVLYIAKIRASSLTSSPTIGVYGAGRKIRKEYVAKFKEWQSKKKLYIPYPLTVRPFTVPIEMCAGN